MAGAELDYYPKRGEWVRSKKPYFLEPSKMIEQVWYSAIDIGKKPYVMEALVSRGGGRHGPHDRIGLMEISGESLSHHRPSSNFEKILLPAVGIIVGLFQKLRGCLNDCWKY